MSDIISESKKISELPAIIGFSEDAVVLIVDGKKTAQMNLQLLTKTIAEATVGKDSALTKSVTNNATALAAITKTLETLSGNQSDFQKEVSKSESGQNSRIFANENNIDNIMYYVDTITSTDSLMRPGAIDTRITVDSSDALDLVVGGVFDYQARFAESTSSRVLVREVKKGEILTYVGAGFVETETAPNIVVVGDEMTILEIASIADIREAHSYTFENDGIAYIPVNGVVGSGEEVFDFKTLIDFTALLDRAGVLEKEVNGMKTNTVPDLQAEMDEIMEALKNNGII